MDAKLQTWTVTDWCKFLRFLDLVGQSGAVFEMAGRNVVDGHDVFFVTYTYTAELVLA